MKYDPELSSLVFEFLADRSRGELTYRTDGRICALLRSRYDDETDFLYMLYRFRDSVHALNDKAENVGIYSHQTGKVYRVSYELGFLEEKRCETISQGYDHICQLSVATILRKINGKPVPETEKSKTHWHDRDYFLRYELDREAYDHFYNGTEPSYQPCFSRERVSLADFVGGINHPQETADRLADAFIAEYSKVINQRLWELNLLPGKIAELEATPGEHHYRRRIARSINDEKMVRVEILKDGIPCECKMKAYALQCAGDFHSSSYSMDAQGSAAFGNAYGYQAKLYPSDIQRICYGRRVLYQKDQQ